MAINQSIDLLSSVFNSTEVIGLSYFIALAVIVFVMVLISRDVKVWSFLFLPISVLLWVLGLYIPIWLWVLGAILMMVGIFSKTEMSAPVNVFIDKVRPDVVKRTYATKKVKNRLLMKDLLLKWKEKNK